MALLSFYFMFYIPSKKAYSLVKGKSDEKYFFDEK